MNIPSVLGLQLTEAERRLQKAGISFSVEVTLPPRESSASYDMSQVRQYVVRQQVLSDDKLVLTVVYRVERRCDDGIKNR